MNADLGVPLSDEKAEGPTQRLKYLGTVIDTVEQTVSLPDGKMHEILEKLNSFIGRDTCSRHDLQSLIGSLQFAAKCIPAGRLFTRRLITLLYGTDKGDTIILDDDFRLDISWWLEFLPK